MGLFTILAIVLGLWGLITIVRGRADERTSGRADKRTGERADKRTSGRADGRTGGRADDEGIDYEELRRAEEEVRDLDVNARPDDGFEGDDWGPGAPRN